MSDWSKADWVDPALGWVPKPVDRLPKRVLIDFATRCNLRCPMCPVWGSDDQEAIDKVKGLLSVENARRILDEVAAATPLVQPVLYGEPLLIPDVAERIRDMKSRGMTVAINTNGVALSAQMARDIIAAGVDSIFVSLDAVDPATFVKVRGVDKLEAIEANILRLLAERGRRSSPRVGVSFTITDANRAETDAFVERWCGVIDCLRTGLVFQDGTFPDMAVDKERETCPALYSTMPVHHDGSVTICCLDGFRETTVGNILEEGAEAVWNGEAFAKVRYYHETGQWEKVPFCTNCNGWLWHDFDEEIRDGLLIRRSPQMTYYNRIDRLENWQGPLLGNHSPDLGALRDPTA